ncbi:terminase large subunit [Clostridiales Family XIII bacterium ASD5510]|uniref:Terminase large subunit n=2 Tax=Bacteria TaxID=2 RepID=A0A9J6QQZ0_9FIRM|nr:terminase TerL endonuclease subunit [Hominibacterium faecale]MCU7379720.1 terminase large subunit [Hominibacterium faecale]
MTTLYTPDSSHLLRYIGEIELGKIIVGQELYLQLCNLKEDFHNDEYIYNTDGANIRMNFMENCVRLTKSPFYNKPMVLMLWQKALIECFYSFKLAKESMDRGMWIDRFKKLLLLIARKNTKSETSSALALSEFVCGNEGSDIVASSNDDAQASIVFDAIDTMRQLIDPDDLDSKRNQRFILNKNSNTKIFKLSDRTKNKEGRNIDFAIVDETHEMKENIIGKSIEQSQSLKDNPKFINITTEGFVEDGYLDQELEKARRVIFKEDDGPAAKRLLPWLYTQDSEEEVWQDRSSWVKSNPTLGIVKKWGYLDEQIDVARSSKADRIFVLSKDFNIKQASVESWLNTEDYMYESVFDLEEFRGSFALAGVDMSETNDLTALTLLMMKPDDSTKYLYTMYFMPEAKLKDGNNDKNAGAKYKEWANDRLITVHEGNDIDLSFVADYIYQVFADYNIRLYKVGYDQRFSRAFINRMRDYGWEKKSEDYDGDLVLVLQNAETLDNAMKLLESDLRTQNANYNENPVCRWCFGNTAIKVNDKGQGLAIKKTPQGRIDGSVSKIIAYEMFRRYRTEFKELIGK